MNATAPTLTALRPAPIREAAHILEPILGRIEAHPAQSETALHIATEIRAALDSTPVETMRAWMVARHGQRVATVQIHNTSGDAWAPLGRTIDANRTTYVTFDGSARYYKGCRVVATTPTALIVADDTHTIAYVLQP